MRASLEYRCRRMLGSPFALVVAAPLLAFGVTSCGSESSGNPESSSGGASGGNDGGPGGAGGSGTGGAGTGGSNTGGSNTGGSGTGGAGTGGAGTGGTGTGGSNGITHVATTVVHDMDGQGLVIDHPPGSAAGDLLILVLHRTDDDLPLFVDGWTRVAECFKTGNPSDCATEADCTVWHNPKFCQTFGPKGAGHDLAQSVFYRTAGPNEPSSHTFDLNIDSTGHPGWAVLTALRGAATTDPVRDWSGVGCDGDSASVFPSVNGEAGDMVLLSQSYDDAIAQTNFGPPAGTTTFGYVSQSDEAGFLFGGVLTSTGQTGTMKTVGPGSFACKDALVSLTVKPN